MKIWNLEDKDAAAEVQSYLVANLGPVLNRSQAAIDEVALLARNQQHADAAAIWLMHAGWDKFNQAEDTVMTLPFGVRYGVRYQFFRHPDQPWRVELMYTVPGREAEFSPLHEAELSANIEWTERPWRVPIVHVSYKLWDMVSLRQEREWLDACGYLHGMTCGSSYGEFSYYRLNPEYPYVKPRVNLRDGGQCG